MTSPTPSCTTGCPSPTTGAPERYLPTNEDGPPMDPSGLLDEDEVGVARHAGGRRRPRPDGRADRVDGAAHARPRHRAPAARQDPQERRGRAAPDRRRRRRPDGRHDRRGRGLRRRRLHGPVHRLSGLVVRGPRPATAAASSRVAATLSVGADSAAGLEALAAAHAGSETPRSASSSRSTRAGRGPASGPTRPASLARRAADLGLEVRGAFTHEGHGYKGTDLRAAAGDDAADGLAVAAASLRAEGIEPTVLSAGSTPTAALVRARRR